MGDATRQQFVHTLRGSLDVLRDAGADHLLIGGLAAATHLDTSWDPGAEDIDLLIRTRDAVPLLDRFTGAGYAVERFDERWLYKVAQPNVTVDLMFRAAECIELDDEHLAHAVDAQIEGVPVRMICATDVVVIKAVFDAVDRRGNWYTCMLLLQRGGIDWDYLVQRSLAHGPARLLSLLLYAATAGIDVPRPAIAALGAAALDGHGSISTSA